MTAVGGARRFGRVGVGCGLVVSSLLIPAPSGAQSEESISDGGSAVGVGALAPSRLPGPRVGVVADGEAPPVDAVPPVGPGTDVAPLYRPREPVAPTPVDTTPVELDVSRGDAALVGDREVSVSVGDGRILAERGESRADALDASATDPADVAELEGLAVELVPADAEVSERLGLATGGFRLERIDAGSKPAVVRVEVEL